MISLSRRVVTREIMDDVTPPADVVDEVYAFLGGIGRWLGGTRATLRRFDELSRSWRPGERVHVLDVACGGGDLARALLAWGVRRGFDVTVTALDISPSALRTARRRGEPVGLRFLCADVHAPPCQDGAFDYVTCALFLHHLRDDEVVPTLEQLARLARRGVVINDLVRGWRHLFWSWLFTRPFNAVLRHDGPLSVRRAFRPAELRAMLVGTGLEWLTVRRHLGHRLTLAGACPVRRPVSGTPPSAPGPRTRS